MRQSGQRVADAPDRSRTPLPSSSSLLSVKIKYYLHLGCILRCTTAIFACPPCSRSRTVINGRHGQSWTVGSLLPGVISDAFLPITGEACEPPADRDTGGGRRRRHRLVPSRAAAAAPAGAHVCLPDCGPPEGAVEGNPRRQRFNADGARPRGGYIHHA